MSRSPGDLGAIGVQAKPWRLSTLVFLLNLVLIGVATLCLGFIGFVASREADKQALQGEIRLFENALRDRQVLMARDQLSVARWNKSYQNIIHSFDQRFVEHEFVDSLWSDFGHDRTFLVLDGRRMVMTSREDRTDFSETLLHPGGPIAEISMRAMALYAKNRREIAGGYRQKPVSARKANEVAESIFAIVDGEPAVLSAMAIVPDDETIAMPDGPPMVLVSAKFIGAEYALEVNAQPAFRSFSFVPGDTEPGIAGAYFPLTAFDGTRLGHFVWASERPGARIWSVVVPLIVVLAGAMGLAASIIARGVGRISSRLEASEERNRQLALRDSLTGLANRRSFTLGLESAVAGLPAQPFAVIACDLDRFKAVNDTFGHAAGDVVLQTIADRLSKTIGSAGIVSRLGGDEFVILLTEFTDRPRLGILAAQILNSVPDPIALEGGAKTDVGISLGIAVAPDEGGNAEAILASADAALYAAKDRGRGVAVFSSEIVQKSEQRRRKARKPTATINADAA